MTNPYTHRAQLRVFGLTVGTILVVIGLWPAFFYREGVRWWALVIGGCLAAMGAGWPEGLRGLYKIWMAMSLWLAWANTRIILTAVYAMIFIPVSFVMRLSGRNPLRLAFEPALESYRIERQPRPHTHMLRPF